MTLARTSTMALVAAALLSPAGCGVGTDLDAPGVEAESLTGPTAVANMSPSGVVESTGNLVLDAKSLARSSRGWSARCIAPARRTTGTGNDPL